MVRHTLKNLTTFAGHHERVKLENFRSPPSWQKQFAISQ